MFERLLDLQTHLWVASFANIVNMFAIDNTAWYLLLYPVYFLLLTGSTVVMLMYRLRARKKQAACA